MPHGHKTFQVGDKVKLGEREGEITEAVETAPGGPMIYSVKCPAAPDSHHSHDVLGCVPQEQLKPAK